MIDNQELNNLNNLNIKLKTCNKCNIEKETSEFPTRSDASKNGDGLRKCCKICYKIQKDEWKANNPEYKRGWDANKDKHKQYNITDHIKNGEKYRIAANEYYHENKQECIDRVKNTATIN